jgi:hypothetical protein
MHNIKLNDGWNEYNQEENCISWEPAFDDKGFPLRDPEGDALIQPLKKPGTIYCAHKQTIIYKNLKDRYKRKRMSHLGEPDYRVFKKQTEEEQEVV